MIACLFMPDFAVAVERQTDTTLAGWPLIISYPRQAQVWAVSVEADADGVRPGISLRQAQALCPQARLISANPARYRYILHNISASLATVTPKVESDNSQPAATIYADLTQLNRAEQFEFAGYINQTAQAQVQLTPALGLASGKFPAYVAAGSIGLNRVLCITPGQESSFLAPLSVTCLPLEPEVARRFELLGLRTVGQFAALSAGAVVTQFGSTGRWLHQLARGLDDRPVMTHSALPQEHLTRQLDGPVTDRLVLVALGQDMAGELAGRLAARGQLAGQLKLTLHLEDGNQGSTQRTLRQPTASPAQLVRHLTTLINRVQINCGVVTLTVQATELIPRSPKQLTLLPDPNQADQANRLRELIPQLVARYGPDCFYEPTITNPHAYLPERRFEFRGVADS